MNEKWKRLVSLLLVFVLLLGVFPQVYAAEITSPTVSDDDEQRWAKLTEELPAAIEGYDPLDPDNPYPYGEPVDNFYPSSIFEPDPYGIMPLADMSKIPDEMYDNAILRALAYTGFNVSWLKKNGYLYVAEYISSSLKTNASHVLSDIGYYESGACPTGDETVKDSSTVSGKAPKISYFESNGLVCASFVTYFLCNYLPNIEGVDTSTIYNKVKEVGTEGNAYYLTTVNTWKTALDSLASKSGSGVTKYTSSSTAYKNLVPGDVIVFARDGTNVHIAIYAGEYNLYTKDGTNAGKYHFIIHVGNARGPEISTVEYMGNAGAKSSKPIAWYHLDVNDDVAQTGFIEVYKKDTNGANLSGAKFKAVNQETSDTYYIGPTNSSGYAKSGELPLGTYVVTETVFPDGYEASGTTKWTVTLTKDTPNNTITINAVNQKITGSLQIQKATNTGEGLAGWVFGVYTDSACTKPISGSPFTTPASGKITVSNLVPGTYYVKETSKNIDYWVTDNGVKTVKVNGNETAKVTITNTNYGYGKIIKKTNTGGSLAGWKFNVYTDEACTKLVSGSPFTTDADGLITARLLPGTYYVKEVQDFTGKEDWDFDTATRKLTVTAGKTSSVTFNNIHHGYAQIMKETNTGENRGGWKFNIYTDESCTKLVAGSPFTSADNGAIKVRLVPGTYWVQEVDESGKNPAWDYDTTVRKVTVAAGETAKVTFSNTHFGYAEITKVTNTGNDLGGWKFDIFTDADCTQKVTGSPFTTSSQGLMSVRLLPGTYYVREVDESAAHPDWVYDTTVHTVTVKAGQTASVKLENQQMGKVRVIKTMPDGGPVSGWVFDIYRKSDNAHMGTYTSAEDGTIISDWFLPGEYLVYEQLDEQSIYWCESENPQTVIVKAGETAAVTFTNRLKPGKIAIEKVDITGAPLAGAEFLLEWSVDGKVWKPVTYTDSQYVKEGTCTSKGLRNGRLVSGKNGVVEFTGLHPERLYRLTETAAPDGYQLLTDAAYQGGLPADKDLVVELTVVNVRTFELPDTGSVTLGTMSVIQMALWSMCGVFMLAVRRKEE